MICDGYNRHAQLDGDRFVYRPFPRREREEIGNALRSFPDHVAEALEHRFIASQVVWAEWECPIADIHEQRPEVYEQLWRLTFGIDNEQQEIDDETNLAEWVYLHARWPWLANTTCKQCKSWWWNPITGELYRNNVDGELEPMRRPPDMQLPCDVGKCPKGHWRNPVELSEKNKQAWRFYETHRASGCPDDPICRWYWSVIDGAIIRSREDQRTDAAAARRGAAAHVARVAGGQSGLRHRRRPVAGADRRIT